MLIPQNVIIPKFNYIDGEVIPIKLIVEQNIEYNINDFTKEGLQAIVDAGHKDYFDDSEKDKLIELGILGMNDYSWSEIQDLIQAGKFGDYFPSSKLNDLDNATLNELEWSDIQYLIKAEKFEDYFSVGDTKDITLNLPAGSSNLGAGKYFSNAVSGTYKVVVLGIDHNSELEGTNRVHFCIGQDSTGKEIAFRTMKMNTANINLGGWNGCPMRTWLNNTLINGLPSDLVSVITPCTKYTDNTGNFSNAKAYVTATSDKLWLLSEFEVFGSRKYADQYEQNKQVQYDYYKNGTSKVRYQHHSTSSASDWWLRSVHYDSHDSFCCVINNGNASRYQAYSTAGVVPGFTIS